MNDIKETWFKWDYVCTNCDSHVEMTIKCFGFHHSEVCPKCHFALSLMSVVDATIPSIPAQPKENKMDNTFTLTDPTLVPITNPDQTISYEFDGGKFIQKISDIANTHRKYNNLVSELNIFNNKVFKVDSIISSRFEDSDDQDTLKEIATALGVSITKEISYTATISVSGNLLADITEDYDLESLVYDNLAGNLYDVDFSIDNVDEDN